jgi:hypothetical protein
VADTRLDLADVEDAFAGVFCGTVHHTHAFAMIGLVISAGCSPHGGEFVSCSG